ncbi:MAG: DUF4082 domain-containing protein [Syntrophobacterales bacterium]|jgi:hypothetical protein|nr:DUF4082 domain-containing protein [Syntrophobacterales bacterium]
MRKSNLLLLLGMLLMFMLLAAPASAFVAWEWTTTTTASGSTVSFSLGTEFTANSSFTVNQLGFFDYLGDGLTEGHDVGIYDLDQNLLTSTTVTNADPLVGHFRYHATTPVTLLAGHTYRIAAVTGNELFTWAPEGYFTDPNVTYVISAYTASAVLTYPNETFSGETGYFGPDFQTVPVPPATYLLGSGLLGLIGWRKFRKV